MRIANIWLSKIVLNFEYRARDGQNATLHGARGLAAFLVVLSHIGAGGVTERFFGALPLHLEMTKFFLMSGQYGVEFFFMISGYLITASILRHETVKAFLLDRCIRLYPVFIPAVMFIFIAGPFIGYRYFAGFSWVDWLVSLFSNLLFLPGVVPVEAALVVAWSLSYEAVFYLSVCGYCILARRPLAKVVFSAAIVMPLIAIYPRMIFFVVGAGVYSLVKNGAEVRFRIKSGFIVNLFLFFVLLFLMQYHDDIGLDISPTAMLLAYLGSIILGYLVFIEIVMQSFLPKRLLSSSVMQFLGTISYSLYIWHTILMFGTKRVFEGTVGSLGGGVSFALFAATSISLSIIVSYASYRVFEVKVAKFLLRKKAGAAERDGLRLAAQAK